MHEVLFLCFGYRRSDTGMSWSRSMLLVGDIARTLLVLSATTNILAESKVKW